MKVYLATALLLGAGILVSDAQAQLVSERVSLVPAQVLIGRGTVRLDGMGGFEAAVRDENFEFNLLDFSQNPAGFGDDRDSWSIDLRYTHQELVERSDITAKNDLKINDGFFGLGFHDPGRGGVGARVDYSELSASDLTKDRNEYRVSGFALTVNKYFTKRLTLGIRFSSSGEDENLFSNRIYNISHKGTVTRGGIGLGMEVLPGLTLGARGDVIDNHVEGESRGSTYNDVFDWNRPGTLGSIHAIWNRGRLQGAVDYTRQDLEGEESVKISWSERFIFNPTNDEYIDELETLSEDRTDDQLKTRWRLDVVPRKISVALATVTGDQKFRVITNPNALGSLLPGNIESSNSAVIAGVSWTGVSQRLLLAGEFKVGSSEVLDLLGDVPVKNTRDETLIRFGGEYLVGERLVGRAGLTWSSEEFDRFIDDIQVDGFLTDETTTVLSTGVGIVPAGGIIQLDMSYDVVVRSEITRGSVDLLGTDRSRFSMSMKYLF